MLWIIPARVGGSWLLKVGQRRLSLQIEQRFQKLAVSLQEAGEPMVVSSARLEGDRISFSTHGPDGTTFTGRIDGSRMSGTAIVRTPNENAATAWQAQLRAPPDEEPEA